MGIIILSRAGVVGLPHVFCTTVLRATNAQKTVHDTVAWKLTSQLVYLTISNEILQTCQIWHQSFICLCIHLYDSSASTYFPMSSVRCRNTFASVFSHSAKGDRSEIHIVNISTYIFAINIVCYVPRLSATTCYYLLSSAIIVYYLLPSYNNIIIYYFVLFSFIICYYLLLSPIICSTAIIWYYLLTSAMIYYHLLLSAIIWYYLLVSAIICYYLLWSVIICY